MERLHINEEYLAKNMSLLIRLKSLIPKEFPNNSLGIDTPSMGYYHLVSEDDRIQVVEIRSSGL